MDNRALRPQRLAHLIAYLSLCMLPAAFAATPHPPSAEPSQLRTNPTKQRLPVHKQVTITPVCGFPKGKVGRLGDSFTGYVQNISGSGIGLAHDRRPERG